ncbi:hypothetical protein SRO_6956 [Streptomyces rochei]|nr:hypothetical protein SRO_6956 [Streptomyces rochei]
MKAVVRTRDRLGERGGGVLDTASSDRREKSVGTSERAAVRQGAQFRRRPLWDAETMDFSPS